MTRKEINRDGDKIVIFTPFESIVPVARFDQWRGGEKHITWSGAFNQSVSDAVKFRDALDAAIQEAQNP